MSATKAVYPDPATGELTTFDPKRPRTTDERLDRMIELLELIAEATLTSAHVHDTGSALAYDRRMRRVKGGA